MLNLNTNPIFLLTFVDKRQQKWWRKLANFIPSSGEKKTKATAEKIILPWQWQFNLLWLRSSANFSALEMRVRPKGSGF